MNDTQKLIDAYSIDYCEFLEAAYGNDMLSDGGAVAIEGLLNGHDLQDKTVLDIGAGIGGVAFYVADKYHAHVIGLELGTDMVANATRRTPKHLAQHVSFQTYTPPHLPFPDHHFDFVYSKGVLTHVQNKPPLFAEVFRVLKPNGYFLITDWLSPRQDQWGKRLRKMCEMENLLLYAETENNYRHILAAAGFQHIEIHDENLSYARYNEEIIQQLHKPETAHAIKQKFGELVHQQAIEGYQLIVDSMKDNELLVRRISSQKPK